MSRERDLWWVLRIADYLKDDYPEHVIIFPSFNQKYTDYSEINPSEYSGIFWKFYLNIFYGNRWYYHHLVEDGKNTEDKDSILSVLFSITYPENPLSQSLEKIIQQIENEHPNI